MHSLREYVDLHCGDRERVLTVMTESHDARRQTAKHKPSTTRAFSRTLYGSDQ